MAHAQMVKRFGYAQAIVGTRFLPKLNHSLLEFVELLLWKEQAEELFNRDVGRSVLHRLVIENLPLRSVHNQRDVGDFRYPKVFPQRILKLFRETLV